MAKGQTPALTEEQAEKYTRVLTLRRAGLTFEQIAEQVGYAGRQGAKEAYDSAIKRMGREPAEDLRILENERLDDLWRRAYSQLAQTTDPETFVKLEQVMIRISARRAGLMGLDAPRQLEITGKDGGSVQTDVGDMLRNRLEMLENARKGLPEG